MSDADPITRLNTALQGRYRIERELGEGGMATVYLARDEKHNRSVALKVLKPELAAVVGAERFLAEIETTANLQHPHILPLFDSGEADGFLFYVMPYVEGETLRNRLERERQLPIDESVRIATDVAEALEAAHEQGVIHRDIKPANILMSKGRPLVADFGIALAVSAAGGGRLTETGLSMGTPYYMSPEQASADREPSAASDVYSLGCVLYEMLVGEPPYTGASAQAVLAKILTEDARAATRIRPATPAHVEAAIRRSLEKLPADRFSTAKEFAAALANPAFRHGEQAEGVGPSRGSRAWLAAAFVVTAVSLAFGIAGSLDRPATNTSVNRFVLDIPQVTQDGFLSNEHGLSMSPDGRRLVFVGPGENAPTQLWVRDMDQLLARPIPGTDGAFNPAISPDGLDVAFIVADGSAELRRVPLDGGPSLLLSDSLIDRAGVSWGRDGYIYTDAALEGDGIGRVPEDGGSTEVASMPAEGENWHASPFALPNGKGVLMYVNGPGAIAVLDAETGEHTRLVDGIWGGYARSGHLLWLTPEGTLFAQRFDQDSFTLSGRPIPIIEGVQGSLFGAAIAISQTGDLLYVTGGPAVSESPLVWVDRSGGTTEFDAEWVEQFTYVALSPDGSQVAVEVRQGIEAHIWVKSTSGGPQSKLTFDGSNRHPTWLHDGEWVGFARVDGEVGIYRKRADGTGDEVLVLAGADLLYPTWSSDGRWLIYETAGAVMGQPLGPGGLPDGEAVVLVDDHPQFEGLAVLSPDDRWLAYSSAGEGHVQVLVRPFPDTDGGNWLIPSERALAPIWSRDGSELLTFNSWQRTIDAVPIYEGETFAHGRPQLLFDQRPFKVGFLSRGALSVAPTGDRFLMISGGGGSEDRQLVLVQNFFQVLLDRVEE